MLAGEEEGVASFGFEAQPFVFELGKARLARFVPEELEELARRTFRPGPTARVDFLARCFDDETFARLAGIREAVRENPAGRFALTAILRRCSRAGVSLYVLPGKSKVRVAEPFAAFREKLLEMAADERAIRRRERGTLLLHDAREPWPELDGRVDLVLTSPPYPNNFDYADALRLEMTFWELVSGYGDLKAYRTGLVRSCAQHGRKDDPPEEAAEICGLLSKARKLKARGGKAYDGMIAGYFSDMKRVFTNLRRMVRPGGEMLLIVGDSAPYGIHVPVEEILGSFAIQTGFTDWSFQKIRDRNTRWACRKHTVPLKEGILFVRG